MFFVVKIRKPLLLGLAALFFGAVVLWLNGLKALPAFSASEDGKTVYVLDAGHGGEDGGAVSADGAKESDVNLAVTLDLDELLRFLGRETVLTRREDVSVGSEDAKTLREKKVSDLKNRVALVNSVPGAVLVSIHQNSLPSVPSVHGAQVFFGKHAPSDVIAASVQKTLNKTVNLDREKQEKKIDPTIYLMKNAKCPAILIECGFVSNPAESAILREAAYQKKLAVVIAAGLLESENAEIKGDDLP